MQQPFSYVHSLLRLGQPRLSFAHLLAAHLRGAGYKLSVLLHSGSVHTRCGLQHPLDVLAHLRIECDAVSKANAISSQSRFDIENRDPDTMWVHSSFISHQTKM